MAGLCEGGNETTGSLKAICNTLAAIPEADIHLGTYPAEGTGIVENIASDGVVFSRDYWIQFLYVKYLSTKLTDESAGQVLMWFESMVSEHPQSMQWGLDNTPRRWSYVAKRTVSLPTDQELCLGVSSIPIRPDYLVVHIGGFPQQGEFSIFSLYNFIDASYRIVSYRIASHRIVSYRTVPYRTLAKGKGTRDAIGLLRPIGERYLEKNKEVYIVFMDLGKAFDRVDWNKLVDILVSRPDALTVTPQVWTLDRYSTAVLSGVVITTVARIKDAVWFKLDQTEWILKGDKILSMTSSGRKVKLWVPCRRFRARKIILGGCRQNLSPFLSHVEFQR
ncbi:hypothetical protein ANN_14774 [Periplaneta americana]|uniref:Reverse transcriptase domain-containing protein n=1 Tax=Periplaneta americana TaxID=6978 RepID=A0ABQ8SX81_PERAM|nr:hypothetical protein ANN_14774 [Periplaneta americana]